MPRSPLFKKIKKEENKMNQFVPSGVIWITGLSSAGKTTFANAVQKHLKEKYHNVVVLEGEKQREIFNNFGYEREQRLKSTYPCLRLIEFLEENQLIVIVPTISAFNEIYSLNRKTFKNYFEVYIHCDFKELVRRDKKGLYSGALSGKIKNVVGVDIPYEEPKDAHFVLENTELNCLNEKTKILCEKVDEFLNNIKN